MKNAYYLYLAIYCDNWISPQDVVLQEQKQKGVAMPRKLRMSMAGIPSQRDDDKSDSRLRRNLAWLSIG